MGSGKSTVGKIISSELFLNFFDTDEEIENRTGASIDWIFDLEGEEGFRKRESKILEDMAQKNSIVLSTGGGIILSEAAGERRPRPPRRTGYRTALHTTAAPTGVTHASSPVASRELASEPLSGTTDDSTRCTVVVFQSRFARRRCVECARCY